MDLGPFRNLHKILTARQHPTETQDDDVYERVFEILSWSARIPNRLQPLHQCVGRRGHTPSFGLRQYYAALSILTSSFHKGLSAFAVPPLRDPCRSQRTAHSPVGLGAGACPSCLRVA